MLCDGQAGVAGGVMVVGAVGATVGVVVDDESAPELVVCCVVADVGIVLGVTNDIVVVVGIAADDGVVDVACAAPLCVATGKVCCIAAE